MEHVDFSFPEAVSFETTAAPSGAPLEYSQPPSKKRLYKPSQLEKLEAYIQICPFPLVQEKKELACVTGLRLDQVSWWFRNRRRELRKVQQRTANSKLRYENFKLRAVSFETTAAPSGAPFESFQPPNRTRFTPSQIQKLEEYIQNNPFPLSKERKELAYEMGLQPEQVRCWIQNKRAQLMKVQQWRAYSKLRDENFKLRAVVDLYREALRTCKCGPTALACLEEGSQRISSSATRYDRQPTWTHL